MDTRKQRRDFARELADRRCWDDAVQAVYEQARVPLADVILQNRAELVALCEWMEAQQIRSYLEIGVWTGRLVSTLHELFDFDLVASCDLGAARLFGLPIRLPFGCRHFEGSSHSPEFEAWRAALGPIDLVMIDGDHSLDGVRRDFEMQRRHPHRFLGFHDIRGDNDPQSAGVAALWRELEGDKTEIVRPNPDLHAEPVGGYGMGIGLWRAQD